MTDPDFPEELKVFIQESIPNVDGVELLLLMSSQPDRQWRVAEIIDEMRPTLLAETAARKQLALFETRGLVAHREADSYQYMPATPQLDSVVRALTKVFNERPVTLVRMIYSLKDDKIRSFADAFKLKKD
jgi:hypothetical protein